MVVPSTAPLKFAVTVPPGRFFSATNDTCLPETLPEVTFKLSPSINPHGPVALCQTTLPERPRLDSRSVTSRLVVPFLSAFWPFMLPFHVPPTSARGVQPSMTSNKAREIHLQWRIELSPRTLKRPAHAIVRRSTESTSNYCSAPGPWLPIRLAGGGGIAMSTFWTDPRELSGLPNSGSMPTTRKAI